MNKSIILSCIGEIAARSHRYHVGSSGPSSTYCFLFADHCSMCWCHHIYATMISYFSCKSTATRRSAAATSIIASNMPSCCENHISGMVNTLYNFILMQVYQLQCKSGGAVVQMCQMIV
jgi:hypothetical protein